MTNSDWEIGDALGLVTPARAEALLAGGADYLTKAFRAMGSLGTDNRVTQITEARECLGGGTGRKLFLAVEYESPKPNLHEKLFVKFSRDFDDQRRDRVRHMMEAEVKFAALSRAPGFPIAVPECVYADFNHESGTGALITQRIAFGDNGIEPQYAKCLDHELPDALEHYEALIKALARLSGAHKAGALPRNVADTFPADVEALIEGDRIRFDAEQLRRRAARLAAFAAAFPHLLPANLIDLSFYERFSKDAQRFLKHESAVRRFMFSNPYLIALCHWNANIDNGWFWRSAEGELECGLLDWGRVGQMSVAQGIYGCLSGADPELWNARLDHLIALFAAEFERSGGPSLDLRELKLHVQLVTATMGLAYIMDAPAIIEKSTNVGDATTPHDPIFNDNEDARVWLHMMTMFLNQWETQNFGDVLDDILRRL